MKEALCRAFCDGISVARVPLGYAITTPYEQDDGDPIVIYAVRQSDRTYRLEDSGVQIPALEASGVGLESGTRGEAFESLLAEYALEFDRGDMVVKTESMPEEEVGPAALRLLGFLLRLQDFQLLTPDRIKRTWQDDALAEIHRRFDNVATVEEHTAVFREVGNLPADVVVRFQSDAPPLAIFFATSDSKGLQALVLKMEMEKYQQRESNVVLMVERAKQNQLREPTYAMAQARLDNVLTYRGAEHEAMMALARYGDLDTLQ